MDLSVVIPTYNRVKLLPRVIDAWRNVHRVTECRYEIIFSDDGSQDGTVEFLRQVKDLPITILENDHGGPSKARNVGVARAIGDRLLFMGDDIFPNHDLLNQHWAHSKRLGETVAVLGEVVWHGDLKLNHLMHHITEVGNEQFSYNRLTANAYTDFRHCYTCNISINRNVILEEPYIFDERFYKVNFEDIELGYRLAKRGIKIFYLPVAVGHHYHPYTIQQFYKRQENAGEMAVVLCNLHPEVDEVIRLSPIKEGFLSYLRSNRMRSRSGYREQVLADVISRCEQYEAFLQSTTQSSPYDHMLIKTSLSNIYSRLFRFSFESGVLNKLFPGQEHTIGDYLQERYFGWDSYWEARTSLSSMWQHYSPQDRDYLAERMGEYCVQSRTDLMSKLVHINLGTSRTEGRWQHLALMVLHKGKRICKAIIRRSTILQRVRDSIKMYRLRRRMRESRAVEQPTRKYLLGIILSGHGTQEKQFESTLFSTFGQNVCLIYRVKGGYNIRILNDENDELQSCHTQEELPVGYLYEPRDIQTALSIEHLKNVVLCLSSYSYDFVLVSHSLSRLPRVGVGPWHHQFIYSVRLTCNAPLIGSAVGKVLRLMPGVSVTKEESLQNIFQGVPISYDDQNNVVYIGTKKRAPSLHFSYAPFIRSVTKKKTVFVWPIFMAVGGVERNTIEIMRQLRTDYHFVLITMERVDTAQGSLHHQLKDITDDVYDLAEIAPQSDFLLILGNLKHIYSPDLIWICNGSPWLADNAMNVRDLFNEIPIIDQQVYDTKEGWINRYTERGIQSFDRFVAINRKIEQVFYERIKIPRNKVDLIYHAIDHSRVTEALKNVGNEAEVRSKYRLSLDKSYFLFVGRLHAQKRPLEFLEFAEKRQKKGDPSVFVMIGNGLLSNEVDEFISRRHIVNVVRISFVENPVKLMLFASGIIFTSAYEGLPVALLEALAVKVPAFCTDVGDIRLILEEYGCGLTVPCSGDMQEYDEGFEKFLRNLGQYRKNLERNAPRILERFSGKAVAHLYATAFSKAIENKARQRLTITSHSADMGCMSA
jgi:glycosyltransferase involved in cell wall biosynthesis